MVGPDVREASTEGAVNEVHCGAGVHSERSEYNLQLGCFWIDRLVGRHVVSMAVRPDVRHDVMAVLW